MQVGVATEVVTVQSKGEELDRSTSDVSTLIAPAGGSESSVATTRHGKPDGVHSGRSAWRRKRSAIDLTAVDQRQSHS